MLLSTIGTEKRTRVGDRLRVGFMSMGGGEWTAGTVYLRNLVGSLKDTFGPELDLSIVVPAGEREAGESARSIGLDDVIPFEKPGRWTPSWVINGLCKNVLRADPAFHRMLDEHLVDVVFGPTVLYRYGRIATLSFLPDFQHRRLPQMFGEVEYSARERDFMRSVNVATRIVLMSEQVRKDFELFAPAQSHKARVLNPVSYVPEQVYERDSASMLGLYGLPEKFFYLPNQFWKHKNHAAAFEAVKTLKGKGSDVCLVCTGGASDYRHPAYFAELFSKISRDDIRDRIIYLGLVPHEHVLLLMRQSLCVLNPSLFEGWGVTVDEARSIGKRLLVSDLPEHREQSPPGATYFDPEDTGELAEKMERIWREAEPGPDLELEEEARRELPGRIKACAEAFLDVATEALREVRPDRQPAVGTRKA